ncbi:hypothetical protein [Flavobacterium faecale]|uniref:hypothetical protein n=1 Tax=Flavobacterium faecale TaxID=1355330 RepID=UPI003AABBF00
MKKKPIIYKILSLLLMLSMSYSCSSELDFDQVNEFKINPIIVANLTYFDVPAHEFVTNGVETNAAFAALNFDAFRDSFFRDNLVRADLFFEITNTINRAYVIDLVMLNKADQIVYAINFNVPASSGAPQVVTKTELFQGAKLDLLKQTDKMGFRLVMPPGTPLTENSPGSLKLRSSATVYMEIE